MPNYCQVEKVSLLVYQIDVSTCKKNDPSLDFDLDKITESMQATNMVC
jgi:hypothetical protein